MKEKADLYACFWKPIKLLDTIISVRKEIKRGKGMDVKTADLLVKHLAELLECGYVEKDVHSVINKALELRENMEKDDVPASLRTLSEILDVVFRGWFPEIEKWLEKIV